MSRATGRRVALVEHQVDDCRHCGEPLRALDSARRFKRHLSPSDAALRTGNPLLYRTLADEKRTCDLRDRKAAYDPEREGNLLRCGQLRRAADEKKAQDVVAIGGIVELFNERAFRVLEVREHFLRRKGPLAPPSTHAVERGIAPDEDKPRGRIARRPLRRPVLERAQASLLEGFLGQIQVAEVAQKRGHRLGTGAAQGGIDPGDRAHVARRPGRNSRSGRISYEPLDLLARPRSLPGAPARSREAPATTKKTSTPSSAPSKPP